MGAHERNMLRFLFHHLVFGALGGAVFGAGLLYFDVAGIWTMIAASSEGPLFLFLLGFGLFITFGSIGMGIGIMSAHTVPEEDGDWGGLD